MRGALEGGIVGHQHLAAPDRAVGAIARTVEAEADDALAWREAVLGHHRRYVGVMVLHFHDGRAVAPIGRLGRQVTGMQIRGDDLGA